jgi:hypothetical protein
MKHEYHEGVKAGENFEKLAQAVFQKPKVAVPKKQPKVKPKGRKPGTTTCSGYMSQADTQSMYNACGREPDGQIAASYTHRFSPCTGA